MVVDTVVEEDKINLENKLANFKNATEVIS